MRGNARHPVRNPAPLPASPCSPAVSRPMKLMEHLSLLFFFSPPDPFLVLNKNHLDAKVTHITRSEVPPAVTLSWHFLTHRQPARPDPSTSRRFWCLGQCRSLVFFFLAPACFPRRRQPRGEPVPIVPLSRPAGQAHISRSPSGGPPTPHLHSKLPKLHVHQRRCSVERWAALTQTEGGERKICHPSEAARSPALGWRSRDGGGGGRGLSPDSTGGAQGSHPRAPQVTRTLGVQNGHLGQSGPLHDSTDSRGQRLPAPSRSPQLCVQPPPHWGGNQKVYGFNPRWHLTQKGCFFFSKKDEVGLVLHAHVR